MTIKELKFIYNSVKERTLYGRYIHNAHIARPLTTLPKNWVTHIGHSVKKKPVYRITIGQGPIKILMWSQMHGNESTTTKALFDYFNFLQADTSVGKYVLSKCTLSVIPILNPDGAEDYTRFNANGIDLNRDAQHLSQPESNILKSEFDSFKPDFCFNLHGQRTIFGAGATGTAATLSFLSPSEDEQRSFSANRKIAMTLIAEINKAIQVVLPNGIGRYDDEFNLDCVGDTFQRSGIPTVLFEAGHVHNDYQREEVRWYVFLALYFGLNKITNGIQANGYIPYFEIPENQKNFRDVVIKNARLTDLNQDQVDLIFQYKEVLRDGSVHFKPVLELITDDHQFYFHKQIDARGSLVSTPEKLELYIGYENDFVLINNEKIALNT